MRIKAIIPNLFTLGNMACGLTAIIWLFVPSDDPNHYLGIGYLMVGAAIFDFIDGFVARLLGVSSPMGKELDSLSDLVTFGVLPGLMVYTMLEANRGIIDDRVAWLPYVGLLIPLFSAWRLARFNLDTRDSSVFYGLSTPMNALFFMSLYLIYNLDGGPTAMQDGRFLPLLDWLPMAEALVVLTIAFSILMVTDIPLLSFKFKSARFKDNAARYIFIGFIVILVPIGFHRSVPIIMALYFLISLADRFLKKT